MGPGRGDGRDHHRGARAGLGDAGRRGRRALPHHRDPAVRFRHRHPRLRPRHQPSGYASALLSRRSSVLTSAVGTYRFWRWAPQAAACCSGRGMVAEVPPPVVPGTLSVPLAIVSRGTREGVAVLMDLDELAGHWTLLTDERELVAGKRGPTRLGFALLLKFYARAGR